jgi:hypothetical protein
MRQEALISLCAGKCSLLYDRVTPGVAFGKLALGSWHLALTKPQQMQEEHLLIAKCQLPSALV